MSGGKGCTDDIVHIAIKDGGMDDLVVESAQKVRKLDIEVHNEIYYPVVTVLPTLAIKNKIQKPEEVKSNSLVEAVKRTETPRRKRRGVWSKVGTVVVSLIAVIAIVLVGLRLAGFRTFTVMSGSMEPEFPVGAMIYVKPVDYKSLQVGDVISYVANDDKTVVTHRIVDIETDEKDASVLRFRTKGDANGSPDSKLVHYKNVLGTPMIVLPHIGYFAYNIQQPPGIYIALVVGTLLLAWTFLPGTLEERRKTARKSVV